MSKAVQNMYSIKRDKAMMTKINLYEKYHVMQKPQLIHTDLGNRKPKDYDQKMKAYNEQMQRRMKALNVTDKDVQETARQYKLSTSQVLSMLELQRYKKVTGKDFSVNY